MFDESKNAPRKRLITYIYTYIYTDILHINILQSLYIRLYFSIYYIDIQALDLYFFYYNRGIEYIYLRGAEQCHAPRHARGRMRAHNIDEYVKY